MVLYVYSWNAEKQSTWCCFLFEWSPSFFLVNTFGGQRCLPKYIFVPDFFYSECWFLPLMDAENGFMHCRSADSLFARSEDEIVISVVEKFEPFVIFWYFWNQGCFLALKWNPMHSNWLFFGKFRVFCILRCCLCCLLCSEFAPIVKCNLCGDFFTAECVCVIRWGLWNSCISRDGPFAMIQASISLSVCLYVSLLLQCICVSVVSAGLSVVAFAFLSYT